MARLSDEELVELFGRQLPDLLERRPDLEPMIYNVFLKILVRKEEVAAVLAELREFRAEVGRRFEQVDQRLSRSTNALSRSTGVSIPWKPGWRLGLESSIRRLIGSAHGGVFGMKACFVRRLQLY